MSAKNKQHRKWYLGDELINEFLDAKHVGVILTSNLSAKNNVDEACKKGRGTFLGLAGVGVRPKGLNPITSADLYRRLVLPKALFGASTNLRWMN